MKKMIVMAALLLVCAAAFAQSPAKPHKVYCLFTSDPLVLSDEIHVDVDYGQDARLVSLDRRLYDEKGKALKFNSVMDAVNYMCTLGWELEEAGQVMVPASGSTENPVYRWVMSKLVTDNSQITDGWITGDKVK